MQRRSFIKNGIIAGTSVSTYPLNIIDEKKNTKPLIVSTWDFGRFANAEGWKVLASNGHALDAIEKAARVTEADETNKTVGYGGYPDRDGKVTLDACIMDEAGNCGSVMAIEHIKHPISVARKVMEKTPHIILVGDGALQFALENGFPKENLLTPDSKKAWEDWLKSSKYEPVINIENQLYKKQDNSFALGGINNHDTIGLLALDASGRLSGGCTTSGMAFKMHGRVGDSPVIGAGLFVDGEVGAATATGVGEEVIRCVGSHSVVEYIRAGLTPNEACKKMVERIAKRDLQKAKTLQIGFLAIDKLGNVGAFAMQKGFTYSLKSSVEEKVISVESYFD
ncbi:MAG: N(4)-(beta-N-acetylglucosaminyl)-L-asparaginase [Chitinophagaceae bacterium]